MKHRTQGRLLFVFIVLVAITGAAVGPALAAHRSGKRHHRSKVRARKADTDPLRSSTWS
jgi:hypothetical protein